MSITKRISQLIEDQGSTVYAVEKKLSLSKARLYKALEKGGSIDALLVEQILALFNISESEKYEIYTGRPLNQMGTRVVYDRGSDPKTAITEWMTEVDRKLSAASIKIEKLERTIESLKEGHHAELIAGDD